MGQIFLDAGQSGDAKIDAGAAKLQITEVHRAYSGDGQFVCCCGPESTKFASLSPKCYVNVATSALDMTIRAPQIWLLVAVAD